MKKLLIAFAGVLTLAACNSQMSPEVSEGSEAAGIIGGKQITVGSTSASKSVVIIDFLNDDGVSLNRPCTGTLIAPHAVLTAAHCVDPLVMRGLGGFNIQFESVYHFGGSAEVRRGLKYRAHPDYNTELDPLYNQKQYDHDLAVLSFAGDVPKGYAIAKLDEDKAANYGNKLVTVYGIGRSKDYSGRRGEDPLYSLGRLRRGGLRLAENYNAKPDHFLTVKASPNRLCGGDSGGPEFLETASGTKLIGVNSTSRGTVTLPNGMLSCNGISQGTKVAPFVEWIRKMVDKLS
jgi:hypothetical protein